MKLTTLKKIYTIFCFIWVYGINHAQTMEDERNDNGSIHPDVESREDFELVIGGELKDLAELIPSKSQQKNSFWDQIFGSALSSKKFSPVYTSPPSIQKPQSSSITTDPLTSDLRSEENDESNNDAKNQEHEIHGNVDADLLSPHSPSTFHSPTTEPLTSDLRPEENDESNNDGENQQHEIHENVNINIHPSIPSTDVCTPIIHSITTPDSPDLGIEFRNPNVQSSIAYQEGEGLDFFTQATTVALVGFTIAFLLPNLIHRLTDK